ncbi:hypothetical protein [Mycolicibacterium frederiksbergense]|uniref:hypothetical protein n=1 Tax=Mycolicibacterium frederiksbergense TaxID=117567 RepID=UPI00265C0369|nr:hypothetical protein [Mycolicibacterium frederiksbergense]MDO0973620.1 hypothetical protein [Mycolicibacterium frederiksbergense]
MSVDEFVSELSALADADGRRELRPIIDGLSRPIRVRTVGRPGVGLRTLTAGLRAAGLAVVDTGADVEVLVIAETAKPEDCRIAAAADGPIVVALNKADLLGAAVPGHVEPARRSTGVPVIPVSGLLAIATLDDELVAAIVALATEPADLGSTDAFCAAAHSVPAETRARLLEVTDLPGTAAAIAAVRAGADGHALTALLRRASNIDALSAGIHAAAAPLRYRRLCEAMTRLRALAAGTADPRLDAVLTGDTAVRAAMAAAAAVLGADGMDTGPDDPLRRAVRWQRYSRGPVNALHRRCGAEIARGALRSGVW